MVDRWAYENGVQLHFITPGRPMENGYIESFNGKFRDECLNENCTCLVIGTGIGTRDEVAVGLFRVCLVCLRTRLSFRDLNHYLHFPPALKPWAKLVRPSGAGFSDKSFHWMPENELLFASHNLLLGGFEQGIGGLGLGF